MKENLTIRPAQKEDMTAVMDLIHELALFEKAPEKVTNTAEQLVRDGFGEKPLFYCILAEWDSVVVGMSFYYYRYSTWRGKRLYLEDLIVKESYRGKKIGEALLRETLAIAEKENCSGCTWQVLDWNTPAIEFYKKFGCDLDGEWINVHLELDGFS